MSAEVSSPVADGASAPATDGISAPAASGSSAAGDPTPTPTDPGADWVRLAVVASVVVAAIDVVFMGLIATVVPVLAIAVLLTGVGVAVVRSRRRAGLVVLGVTALALLAGSLEFSVGHLGHPESGIDWFHAVIAIVGRAFVLVAVVAAWRAGRTQGAVSGDGPAAARVAGVVGLGVLGAAATVALLATAITSGEQRQDGDVTLVVDATAFPERLTVASGDVLFVDNQHVFRHNFTVQGTDVDVELPALQGVRIPIDLTPGNYELLCDIPGHEEMVGTLEVASAS